MPQAPVIGYDLSQSCTKCQVAGITLGKCSSWIPVTFCGVTLEPSCDSVPEVQNKDHNNYRPPHNPMDMGRLGLQFKPLTAVHTTV